MAKPRISVQMYTVRDRLATADDMAATLAAIAAAGYDGVELAGLGEMSIDRFVSELKKNKLTLSGAHVVIEGLQDNFDFWVELLTKAECRRVSIPFIDPARLDEPVVADTLAAFNDMFERLAKSGIELSYHNHDFEFTNGRHDRIVEGCPDMKFELDTYWAEDAGMSAIETMRRLGERLSLVHIKDRFADPEKRGHNPNLLDGCLDIAAIMTEAEKLGVEWAIVEMDNPIGGSIEAITASRKNLAGIGW